MTNKGSDYYLNSATNKYELKSNPSPLREERTEKKKVDLTAGAKYVEKEQRLYENLKLPGFETAAKSDASYKKIKDNDLGPVKYDKKTGYPNKASPKQMGAAMERLEESRQMTGAPDKPKIKKINPYNNLKISIPTVNFARLRNPEEEMRKAAEDRIRVAAFTPKRDPDLDRGVGSLKDNIAKKLRAAESKGDWKKRNTTTYRDNSDA